MDCWWTGSFGGLFIGGLVPLVDVWSVDFPLVDWLVEFC